MKAIIETCDKDGVMSDEFVSAVRDGAEIYSETVIGWIKVDHQSVNQVRNGVKYKAE